MQKAKVFFILIVILGLALRLYKLDIPLLEFYPTRQVQTAEIARNFYKEGYQIFAPTVGYFGPEKSLFLVEFPLYNFTVATAYKLAGGVYEYLGRLLSIAGWLVAIFFIFQLAKKYIGELGAQIAVFFYTFSPLSVMVSRSFQPDQWMLTFSLGSIYFLDKWKDKRQISLFFFSSILAAASILMKIPSVIFTLVPLIFILWQSKIRLISPKTVIFFTLALLPAFCWYLYAAFLSVRGAVPQGNFSIYNWFGPEVFINFKYYSTLFGYEYNFVLLPTGIVLLVIGLFVQLRKKSPFLYFWLGSVIIYFLIFNKPNMVHEYYHLPLLPIASIFMGIGAERILKKIDPILIPKRLFLLLVFVLIFILMSPPTLQRAYKPIERFRHVEETAEAIRRLTKPTDLVIGSMDGGPTLVYYADRTGWGFEINREDTAAQLEFTRAPNRTVLAPEEDLERLRSHGARVFASANRDQFLTNKQSFSTSKSFSEYMYKNYTILEETENYIVFDISSPKIID